MKLQSMCINFTVLTPVCRECCVFYGSGKFENNDVFHDRDVFLEDYKEMNRSLKIYVYPHREDDPFANVLLPV